MHKIHILPDFVADQIAAGEVLENPASAVKELLENSLDAGAREIIVEIDDGGLQKIRIEDDGCGMNRHDALLCLKRHATSKIRSADDLLQLSTMGFRGEALAALAAVSKLEICTSDGYESTKLNAEGGQIGIPKSCARNQGTSIEARSLFFNAPARWKFQKGPSTCSAAILKVVQTISIAFHTVRFRLFSNGKLVFEAIEKERKERVEEILGAFAHSLCAKQGDISIEGFLGRPEEGKATRRGQMLFLNRRPVVSHLLSKAVKEGFGTRMVESLFPVFVLFLEMPSDLVDFNVHPQKKEIRFREEGKIFSFVRRAVASAFGEEPVSKIIMPWDQWETISSISQNFPVLQDASLFQPSLQMLKKTGIAKVVWNDFLLVDEEAWILIDLRGAEARIIWEAMNDSDCQQESLLIPIEWKLQPGDDAGEMLEFLQKARIEGRIIGKKYIAIDALPFGFDAKIALSFLQNYHADKKLAAAITKTYRNIARTYSFELASEIWRKLNLCKDQLYDPLGKKIRIELTKQRLSEMFQ